MNGRPPVSRAVRELLRKGWGVADVAAKIGCSRAHVYKLRRQVLGLTAPRGNWTARDIRNLRLYWAAGWSAGAIARALCRNKNQVLGKAHRLGLAPRQSPIVRRAA